MRLLVSVDRDRLVVRTEDARELPKLSTALRQLATPHPVQVIKGGYSIPVAVVGPLASAFPPEAHNWDLAALEAVAGQRAITDARDVTRAEVTDALAAPLAALGDYPRREALDPHQLEAVAAMTVPTLEGIALFDEQGAGKTICALAAFDVLKRRRMVTHLLIVAPKSVVPVWLDEIDSFLGDDFTVATLEGRLGSLPPAADIYVASYGGLVASVTEISSLASTMDRRFMLVVDESFYVKNPEAQRSAAVSTVRGVMARAFVLCGTPAPNSAVDVVNQMNLADRGATFDGVTVPDEADGAAVVIEAALGRSATYLRRLKKEVLPGLPPKNIQKLMVELEPDQRTLYESARAALVDDVKSTDEEAFRRRLSEFMARKWALLQICSNPVAVDGAYDKTPKKMLALDALLEDLIVARQEKVVVWSFFRQSLQRIVDRYADFGVVHIDGSVPIEKRREAVKLFQRDPATNLFVGNPAAAGAGITLTAAANAVFESFSNQPAHYLQSVDRIHRRGQERDVNSFILLARDTVEPRDFERLLDKERVGHWIFSKSPDEPSTRELFLEDLIGTG